LSFLGAVFTWRKLGTKRGKERKTSERELLGEKTKARSEVSEASLLKEGWNAGDAGHLLEKKERKTSGKEKGRKSAEGTPKGD